LVLQDLRSTAAAVQRLASEDPRIRLKIDPTLVRGMGYYTGQIFEISHDGSESSIAGGGRYDQLVGRALGRAVPACGLSIGFDRIVELATVQTPALGIAVVYKDESSDKVLTAARELRRAGHRTALVPRRKALRQQLDSLKAEGYTGFVLFEDGVAGAVRSFGESPRAVAVGPLDEP
jgi:histidyl-tRNA synthetase